jgi:hypothetical protein
VELEEIEQVLQGQEGIGESVVVVREDHPGDQRLVAYLVAKHQPQPTVSELRTYLQGKLPAYMLPATMVFLDQFPLTPSGKVDRRSLPAPESTRSELHIEAPRTAAEEVIVEVWCQVLHLEQVGVNENFFALGGHSLLATQVISKLRKIFQVDIPLRIMFEQPTIDGTILCLSQLWEGREVIEEIASTWQMLDQLSASDIQNMLGE